MSAWQLLCVTLNIFLTSSCSTAAGWDGSASRPGCRLVWEGNCQVSFHRGHNIIQTAANQIHPASQQAHGDTGKSWINLEKTWENHGTTPEIPGKKRGMSVFQKCLSVIFRSRRVRPGFRKSLRGDSFKSPSNLGKSWKITSNFKASMKQQNSWFFWHMRKQFVNKMFGRN